jgi:hypothetical protein
MTAPMVLDGSMTGECFVAYVQQILVPTLRPGDIVILDNLPAHKTAAARDAIEAAGAQMLLLPPYSPDFNPRPICLRPPHGPSLTYGCDPRCLAAHLPKRLRQLLLCRRL